MVVDFPLGAVAGARRTPGRLKTGGVPPKPPATIFLSLWPSVFWDFGSLFRTFRGHFLTRCRGSRLLRPRRCGDFGLVSRHKPSKHHFLMFPPRNCQCTRSSCRVKAKSTEKFSWSSASSVFQVVDVKTSVEEPPVVVQATAPFAQCKSSSCLLWPSGRPGRLQPGVNCLWPFRRSILFSLRCHHSLRLQRAATERDGVRFFAQQV